VGSRNAKFLEDHLISGSDIIRNIVSVHVHIESQPSVSSDRLVVVHNIPQVQLDVDQPPIIEIPHNADILVDQIVHHNMMINLLDNLIQH
jgi:hypothetical protein